MALKRVGVELTAEQAATFMRAMDDANTSVRTFGRAADDAGARIGVFEQVVIGGLRRVGAAAVDLSVQGGRALIGLIGDTLSAAGDFEATLNNFASKTGSAMEDAGYDLQDFSAEFLRLGAETKFSAAEAGDAAVELAKGGVSVTDIMGEATAAVLNLAAAADLELAPAAAIVAKQLGVWADSGVTATDVVDRLAQAANASEVDVDELALGLANVGGVAKAAGLSFDETVTALALIAPGFSSSADAGTSFKTMLAALQPSSASSAEAMQQLGLFTQETGSAFYDAMGEFVGLEEMTRLLTDATKDLNTEDKSRLLRLAFGSDAQRAALGIIDATTEGLHQQTAAMATAGSAAEQAARMNTGYNAAMDALGGSLDTVQIILGTLLLPTLTAFVETAVVPAVNAVGDFATALGASSDPMGMIVEQLKLGATMLSTWVIDSIPSVIGGLATLGQALIEWTVAQLPAWAAGLQALGQQAIQWISDSLPGWQAAAAEYLTGLLAWVEASLPGWVTELQKLGSAAIQWIADSAPGWLAQAEIYFNSMIAWVGERLPGWIEELKKFANAAIQWVLDALPGLGTNLGILAGDILAWVVRTTGELVPVLAGLALKFVEWVITDVIPALPGALLAISTAIYNFIAAVTAAVVPELLELAKKFYLWVTETAIPGLLDALPGILDAITNWVGGAAEDAYQAVITIGTNIIAGITKGVTDAALGLLNAVVGAVEDAWNAVTGFLGMQSPSKLYFGAGENMMLGLAGGVEATQNVVDTAIIDGLRTSFLSAMDLARTGGNNTGNAFTQRFQDALHGSFNGPVQTAINDALSLFSSGTAAQAQQGGWLVGSSFASAFQQAIGGLGTGGSWIDMPEISGAFGGGGNRVPMPGIAGGAFSGGSVSNVTSSQNNTINYNGVSSPPPPSQSFAALAAWAG